VDPRAGLDVVAKRKNSSPCLELNPGHPAHSIVTILTELSQLAHHLHHLEQDNGTFKLPSPSFMEPSRSLTCSQEPATHPSTDLDESSAHCETLFLKGPF
jgi:hypothetical protein